MEIGALPSSHSNDVIVSAHENNNKYLCLLTACSTIGGFLFGYDTGVTSGALALIKSPEEFNLDSIEIEAIVSGAVGSAIVGAAMSNFMNQALGRKPVILISSALFTIGAVIMGVALSFALLLLGRIVVGLAIGMASMAVPLYIAEAAPPSHSTRRVSLVGNSLQPSCVLHWLKLMVGGATCSVSLWCLLCSNSSVSSSYLKVHAISPARASPNKLGRR